MVVIMIADFQFTAIACTVSTRTLKVLFWGDSYLAYKSFSHFITYSLKGNILLTTF